MTILTITLLIAYQAKKTLKQNLYFQSSSNQPEKTMIGITMNYDIYQFFRFTKAGGI
jgi:hypothetical protein